MIQDRTLMRYAALPCLAFLIICLACSCHSHANADQQARTDEADAFLKRISQKHAQEADEMFETFMREYPDYPEPDKVLLKWALNSYRMKNYRKAKEQCLTLIKDHPKSPQMETAHKMLGIIAAKTKKRTAEQEAPDG